MQRKYLAKVLQGKCGRVAEVNSKRQHAGASDPSARLTKGNWPQREAGLTEGRGMGVTILKKLGKLLPHFMVVEPLVH